MSSLQTAATTTTTILQIGIHIKDRIDEKSSELIHQNNLAKTNKKKKGKDLIINLSDGDGLTLWATHSQNKSPFFVNNNNNNKKEIKKKISNFA